MARATAVGVLLLALATPVTSAQTVSKATPTTVQLQAGGAPVGLTLLGQNLSGVSSARVVLKGQPVSGLAAVIRSAASTGVSIELSAGATAPAGTYYLELTAGGQRILVPSTTTSIAVTTLLQKSATTSSTLTQSAPTVVGSVTVASPTVTSALPATADLRAGAAALNVTLTGTVLNQIVGAYAEQNGVRLSDVSAAVQPATSSTQLTVSVAAAAGAKPRTGVRVMLQPAPGTGGLRAPAPIAVPVQLEVLGTLLISESELFASAVNSALAGAIATFNSCGGDDAARVFVINLPVVAYSAKGSVPRYERTTSLTDRASFLERHSITPNDAVVNPAELLNIAKSGHPSPVPHTITALRMCMMPTLPGPAWKFASAVGGKAPSFTVTAPVPPVLFRARGMPADPSGAIDGIKVGILWGDPITDLELADREYLNPVFDVMAPLAVSNGVITVGTPQVNMRAQARWTSTFFGPDAMRAALESYATSRMQQISQEVQKAMNAAGTRNAIAAGIMSTLKAKSIGQVVDLREGSSDMWQVAYR